MGIGYNKEKVNGLEQHQNISNIPNIPNFTKEFPMISMNKNVTISNLNLGILFKPR